MVVIEQLADDDRDEIMMGLAREESFGSLVGVWVGIIP
jgi:hypothetical protein